MCELEVFALSFFTLPRSVRGRGEGEGEGEGRLMFSCQGYNEEISGKYSLGWYEVGLPQANPALIGIQQNLSTFFM